MEKAKQSKYPVHAGLILALVWLLVASFAMPVFAATSGSGSTGEGGFSWSWSTDNKNTNAAGELTGSLTDNTLKLTISATSSTFKEGSCGGSDTNAESTTNTATVTNNTGFTISIASVTENNAQCSVSAGTKLIPGDTFTVSITADPNGTSDTTAQKKNGSVDITYTVIENVDVVYYGADGASYTYGEVVLADAAATTTTRIKTGSSITLPAAPTVSGGTFAGWRLSHDGSLRSAGETVTLYDDTSVYPVVLIGNETYPYTVNGAQYCFWEDAAYAAGTNGTIILNQDYTLPSTLTANGVSPAGGKFVKGVDGAVSYTIPSGVTLLIPFDDGNTLVTNNAGSYLLNTYDASVTVRSEYRKLTMSAGAKIKVEGAISVGSKLANQFIGQVGPYGAIYMESESNITVQSGGTLYAWGYIFHGESGSGTVTVEPGGTVYEPLSIMDYPGSTSSTSDLVDNNVFPMRSYSFRNVEVPMTLNSGAREYGFACLYGDNPLVGTNPLYVLLIANGTVNGETPMFQNSGTVTKSYTDDRAYIAFDGNLSLNSLTVERATSFGTVTISTSSTSGVYIPSCWDIVVSSGTVTLNDNVIMCEGSTLTVNKDAVVDTNKNNVYVLDADNDPGAVGNVTVLGATAIGGGWNGCSVDVQNVHGNYYTYVPYDAVLNINGKLIVSGGFYTSAAGACITSSEGGGVIQVSGSSASTTVMVKNTNSATGVSFSAAQLLNSDESYQSTASGANTYIYTDGKWICETHTYETTSTATCTAGGTATYTCSVCGHSYTEDVPALGHDYVDHEAKAETCTEIGWEAYQTCSRGDYTTYQEIAALGHDYVDHEAQTVTCTEIGWDAYQTCSRGDYTTYQEIPALGHVYPEKPTFVWAENNSCSASLTCTRDGCTEGTDGHTLSGDCTVTSETTAATCQSEGKTVYTATVTLNSTEYTDTQEVTIAINSDAHAWDNACDTECNNDATHTREITHEYGEWVVTTAPTCEADGEETRTCSVCGDKRTQPVTQLGHDMKDVAGKDATCTEDGYTAYKDCARCDYIEGKKTISKLDHTEVIDAAVAPTCTKTGLTEGKHCSVCGEVLIAPETVDALGHTEVIDAAVAPTCTEPGLTEGKHCSVCEEVLVAQKTVDALGHTEVIDAAVAPTCTEPGLTEGKHCSVCTEVLVAQEEVPATNHANKYAGEAEDATCTEEGHTAGEYCPDCKTWVVPQETIAATGHQSTKVINAKDATCGEAGYTGDTYCNVCQQTIASGETIPATGEHTPGEAVKEKETADSYDSVVYCSICGEELSRETITAGPVYKETLKFYSVGISFQDYIGLQAGVLTSVAADYDEIYVMVNGEKIEGQLLQNVLWVFDHKVMATKMTEEATFVLYGVKNGQTYMGQTFVGSVETVALEKIASYAASGNTKACAALVDMLNYGAVAQTYFGDTGPLANANLGDYSSYATATTPVLDKDNGESGNGDIKAYNIAMSMQSVLEINVGFLQDMSAYEVHVTADGITTVYDGSEFDAAYRPLYILRIPVGAVNVRTEHTIEIYDKLTNELVSPTYIFSAEGYANTKINTGAKEAALMDAIMRYGDSVAAYSAN